MSKLSIIEALEQISESDLQDIDVRIVEAKRTLASLRTVRKLMQVKLHGKPGPKPGARKAVAESNGDGNGHVTALDKYRLNAAQYLRHSGKAKVATLAERFGMSSGGQNRVSVVFNHDWFASEGREVSLTDAGKTAVDSRARHAS